MSDDQASMLVVLDVDSTLCNEEGIDEIACAAGEHVAAEVAAVTARAMAGELDFAESLRQRVATLTGLTAEVIHSVSTTITATEGAHALVRAVQAAGGRVCAVSGGFHELVDPLATSLGLDDWQANRFAYADGVLTGELDGLLVDAHGKREALKRWRERWHVPPDRVFAVGDGANDLEMMAEAGVSIAFCAKPVVRERATVAIDRRDLREVAVIAGIAEFLA